MTDIAVRAEAVEPAPYDYTIPGAQELLPKSVSAAMDGSSAAGPWFPCLQFVDPSGHVMVSCVSTTALAAGASADVSWFPGAELEEEQAAQAAGVIVETFYVQSPVSTPVTSATTLQSGRTYLITVQGTFSLRNVALTIGNPQADAMFPTSTVGRVSLQVGWDAECIFAEQAGGNLGHDTAFRMNLGDGLGMRHVEPDGGPFSTPQTNFFYTYTVTGSGSTIQAQVFDSDYTDNYGKLLVTIQTVGGGSSGGGAGSLLPDPSLASNGSWLRTSAGTAVWSATPQVAETDITLSDVTTQNVSTSKHGLAPKLPNDATKYLDGTGAYTVPSGTGGSAVGNSSLVYRYTVTGSTKASIDTGSDTPDAGSNDWTNGDLLEVLMLVQTTEAATQSGVSVIFNNDTGGNYDRGTIQVSGGSTLAGSQTLGASSIGLNAHGNSGTNTYASAISMIVPDFAGTTFWKSVLVFDALADDTSFGANNSHAYRNVGYRSTSALSRLKVTPTSGNLAIGSQLLIYKRLAS